MLIASALFLASRLQGGPQPNFVLNATFFRNEGELQNGRALEFGITTQRLDRIIDQACAATYRLPVPSSLTVDGLASDLKNLADRSLVNGGVQQPSKLLRQWLCAEVISAWVMSHMGSDPDLAAEKDYKRWWDQVHPEFTLNRRPLRTICSGSAWLSRDLARALKSETGLDAEYVGGWMRSDDGSVPEASNHAWTSFTFEGGLHVPSDDISPLDPVESRAKWIDKHAVHPILPRSREAWEVFLAFHYGMVTFEGDSFVQLPKNPTDPFTRLTFTKWREKRDVSTALALRQQRKWID